MKNLIFSILICLFSISARCESYLLVAEYGETPLKTTRWPDGTVEVYDATNYAELDSVLALINKNTNNTRFVQTLNKESAQIQIVWEQDFDYPYKDKCGLTHTFKSNYIYTKSLIQLKPGACTKKGTIFSLYLHELGHAAGFARHTTSEDVMAEALYDTGHYESVNVLTTFLMGLYTLPPGSLINRTLEIPRPIGSSLAKKETDRTKNTVVQTLVKKKQAEIITLRPLVSSELKPSTIRRSDQLEIITPHGVEYRNRN